MWPTCFATNTTGTPIAVLELRHRRRARAEGRMRAARDTGLRNLPRPDGVQNQIWLEIVQLALDLLAWMPMLALTGDTRRWEPKRLHPARNHRPPPLPVPGPPLSLDPPDHQCPRTAPGLPNPG